MQLDDSDVYYNTKFQPPCGEGDVVGIEYIPKGDTRANVRKIVVLQDNSGGYEASNSEKSRGKGFSGGGGSYSSGNAGGASSGGNRNESIVLQHSQEMAIRAAALILSETAWSVKGKADDKYLQVEALIDQLTVKFYKDALNPADSELLKEAKKIEDDAKGGAREDESWDEDSSGESSNDDDDWGDDDWN